MIDDFIESHVIDNINNYVNILKHDYNITVLYNKERIDEVLHIDYKIYNSNYELLVHRFDTLSNTYNFISGMLRGIRIIKELEKQCKGVDIT